MIKFSMTRNTNRNNVKPMFGFVTWVMVLLCLFATGTLQSIRARYFACSNGVVYSGCRFRALWEVITIFATFAFIVFSSFLSLDIFVSRFSIVDFANFTLTILFSIDVTTSFMAYFAISLMTIFLISVFVKFGKRFSFLAGTTTFGYDLHSHFRLLYRRFWLKPIAAQTAVGSFYFNKQTILFNEKIKNFKDK